MFFLNLKEGDGLSEMTDSYVALIYARLKGGENEIPIASFFVGDVVVRVVHLCRLCRRTNLSQQTNNHDYSI